MFGRQAVLPVDFIGSTKPCSEEVLQDFKCSLYSKHTEERKKLLEVVKANIVKAQVKQKGSSMIESIINWRFSILVQLF